jgi:hypothetical protein
MTDQAQAPVTVDLSQYIETRLMEDRPHIRDRRVPVALIALSVAALLYYQQHQDVVETLEAEEQARMDEMYRLHGRSN